MSFNFLLERLLNEEYLVNALPKSEFDDYEVVLYKTDKSLIINKGNTHSINKKGKVNRQAFKFGFRPSSLGKGYVVVKPNKPFKFEYLSNGLVDEEATKNKVMSALGLIDNQLLFKYQVLADYDVKHRRVVIKPNSAARLKNSFNGSNKQVSKLYPIIINEDYILFNGRDAYSNSLVTNLLHTDLYLNLTTVKFLNHYQQLSAKLRDAELNQKTTILTPSHLKTLKSYDSDQFKTFIDVLEDDFNTLIKSDEALPSNLGVELNNKLTEAIKDKLSTSVDSLEKTLSLEFEYALRKSYEFFLEECKPNTLTFKNGQTININNNEYKEFPKEFESLLNNFHDKGLNFLLKDSNNFLHLVNYFNLSSFAPYLFEKHFKELSIDSSLNYLKLVMDSFAFNQKQNAHNFSYPNYSIKFIKTGFCDKSLIKQKDAFTICANDSFKYKWFVKKFGFNPDALTKNSLIIEPVKKFNHQISSNLVNSIESLESLLVNNGLKPEVNYHYFKDKPIICLKTDNCEFKLNQDYLLFNVDNPHSSGLLKLLLDSDLFSFKKNKNKPIKLIDFAKLVNKADNLESICHSMVSNSGNGFIFSTYIPRKGDKMCITKTDSNDYYYTKVVSKDKIRNLNSIFKKTDNVIGVGAQVSNFDNSNFLRKVIMRFPNFSLDKGSIKRKFSDKLDYYYLTDGDDELAVLRSGLFLSYSENAFKVGESILKNNVTYYDNKLNNNSKLISQNINSLSVNERTFLEELIDKFGLTNNDYSIVNSHVYSLRFRQPLGLKSLNDLGDLSIFKELSDLSFINQSGLKFTKDLASLIKLNNLKISNCDLKRAPKYISKLVNLIELDLSDNQIKRLNKNLFYDLNNINKINLSNNKLNRLPINFNYMFLLSDVNLSNNKFKKVPFQVMFERNINHLDLSNNPLKKNNFKKAFDKTLKFIPNLKK